MTHKILLDSWAWIELFKGTPAGKKALQIVQQASDVYTTTANLFEVVYRIETDAGHLAAQEKREFIAQHAQILPISLEVALKAVEFKTSQGLAAMDAFTAAAAFIEKAQLITGDPDFKNVENVILLK